MKIRAKVGTHSSGVFEVDGRTLGKQRPVPIGKCVKIKYMGRWQIAIVDNVIVEDNNKNNLHFLSLQ